MIAQETLLVSLVKLVEQIPQPAAPAVRQRGRAKTHSDRLFLKAMVIMIVRHVQSVSGLWNLLEQPSAEMQCLRQLLHEQGRYPTRRTFERRLKAIPATLPAQIACLGHMWLPRCSRGLCAGAHPCWTEQPENAPRSISANARQ